MDSEVLQNIDLFPAANSKVISEPLLTEYKCTHFWSILVDERG